MKILIVDDNATTKCRGILEECQKRNIEVEIAKAINQALRKIILDEEDYIDGIILDMGLPTFTDETKIDAHGGEKVLRELERKGFRIPTLIFSETELRANYIQIFDQMKYWDVVQEQKKFFDFIEELEKREKGINL